MLEIFTRVLGAALGVVLGGFGSASTAQALLDLLARRRGDVDEGAVRSPDVVVDPGEAAVVVDSDAGTVVIDLDEVDAQRHRATHAVPERGGSEATGARVELPVPGWRAYSLASAAFSAALIAAVLVLLVFSEPPTEATSRSFDQFLSSCAQVLVGLLIAVAIELRSLSTSASASAPRLEAALGVLWIAVGQALALVALLPDCPPPVFAAALVIVPAAIFGALVAILGLVAGRGSFNGAGSPN